MRSNEELKADLQKRVGQYKRRAKPFFDALRILGGRGHTPVQYECLRVNYLHRIETTPFAVSSVVRAALRETPPDLKAAKFTLRENLLDEMGRTDDEAPHLDLLVSSMNIFGALVHGLPALRLGMTRGSPFLSAEAEVFRAAQVQIYSSESYQKILGASFAQEAIAQVTLKALRKNIFNTAQYEEHLDPVSAQRVDLYFSVHLDEKHGHREERHKEFALNNIVRASTSKSHRLQTSAGCKEFLDAHIDFFNAIGRQLVI